MNVNGSKTMHNCKIVSVKMILNWVEELRRKMQA